MYHHKEQEVPLLTKLKTLNIIPIGFSVAGFILSFMFGYKALAEEYINLKRDVYDLKSMTTSYSQEIAKLKIQCTYQGYDLLDLRQSLVKSNVKGISTSSAQINLEQ